MLICNLSLHKTVKTHLYSRNSDNDLSHQSMKHNGLNIVINFHPIDIITFLDHNKNCLNMDKMKWETQTLKIFTLL